MSKLKIINKLIRNKGKVYYHKEDEIFYIKGKEIITLSIINEIVNPTFLQKNRFIVLEGPILVETDAINDIIYTDFNGNRYFSKDNKLLSSF